jgi:hypothetical protein
MRHVVAESVINDNFHGWDGDNYYELANGQVWQQVHYEYSYHYAYRPRARILQDGARYYLEVEGMSDAIEVRRVSGTLYIYDSRGSAVGFWRGKYVYALNGTPIGQLNGCHVHKLSGQYVGELHKDMVVDKHLGNLGNIGNSGNPGNPGHPGNPSNRGAVNYGFPDVFHKLLR